MYRIMLPTGSLLLATEIYPIDSDRIVNVYKAKSLALKTVEGICYKIDISAVPDFLNKYEDLLKFGYISFYERSTRLIEWEILHEDDYFTLISLERY